MWLQAPILPALTLLSRPIIILLFVRLCTCVPYTKLSVLVYRESFRLGTHVDSIRIGLPPKKTKSLLGSG